MSYIKKQFLIISVLALSLLVVFMSSTHAVTLSIVSGSHFSDILPAVFSVSLDVENGERVPLKNLTILIEGEGSQYSCTFDVTGATMNQCNGIDIRLLSMDDQDFGPESWGYGLGTGGYANTTFFESAHGYGYSDLSFNELEYEITWQVPDVSLDEEFEVTLFAAAHDLFSSEFEYTTESPATIVVYNADENLTINEPNVVVTLHPGYSVRNIFLGHFAENVSLDVNALSYTLDEGITVHRQTRFGEIEMQLPSGIHIQSESWDGRLLLTTFLPDSDVRAVPDLGMVALIPKTFALGSENTVLNLSMPVRLFFEGCKGYVGYAASGHGFTKIDEKCHGSDTIKKISEQFENVDDCFRQKNAGLILWTEHFTRFIIFSQMKIGNHVPIIQEEVSIEEPEDRERRRSSYNIFDHMVVDIVEESCAGSVKVQVYDVDVANACSGNRVSGRRVCNGTSDVTLSVYSQSSKWGDDTEWQYDAKTGKDGSALLDLDKSGYYLITGSKDGYAVHYKTIEIKDCSDTPVKRKPEARALFDIDVMLTEESVDDELLVKVTLMNFGRSGVIDANVVYTITDSAGNLVHQQEETVPVEAQVEFLRSFNVSQYPDGEYTILLDLSYDTQVDPAQAVKQFTIYRQKSNNYFGFILVLVLGVMVLVYYIRQIRINPIVSVKGKTLHLEVSIPNKDLKRRKLHYGIFDSEHNMIYSENEHVRSEGIEKSFDVDYPKGEYALLVSLTYTGQKRPVTALRKFWV